MVEAFPHHSLLAKCLRSLSGFGDLAEDVRMSYPSNCRPIAPGRYPKPFDTNIRSSKGSFVDVAESAKCDRLRGSG